MSKHVKHYPTSTYRPKPVGAPSRQPPEPTPDARTRGLVADLRDVPRLTPADQAQIKEAMK